MRLFRPFGTSGANVRLQDELVLLRAPVDRDWRAYAELRAESRQFLEPWEPTWPADALTRESFQRRLSRYASDWRADAGYTFLIFTRADEALLGGVSLSNVRRGVAQTGTLGYWMGKPHAGKGYMTHALRLVLDFCFDELGLHRVEAACLPTNEPSQRLLRRSGFNEDGYARKYLKICGEWHDHLLFSLLAEDHTPPPQTAAQ
jgi:ribosomal-protein-alanine N-acetyltransferase